MKARWRRAAAVLAVSAMLASGLPGFAHASGTDIALGLVLGYPKAYISGGVQVIDPESEKAAPQKKDGVVIGPVKFIAQQLGAEVTWDEAENAVRVTGNGTELIYREGSASARINGADTELALAVTTVDGRAMVPLQSLAEALGYKIFWNKRGAVLIGGQNLNPRNESAYVEEMTRQISGEMYWEYNGVTDFVPVKTLQDAVKFPAVTEKMVADAIAAKNQQDVHPRLIATKDDINRIKRLVAEGDVFMTAAYDKLMKEAAKSWSYETPVYGLDDAGLRVAAMHSMGTQVLPILGLAYQLTGDKKYATEAWRYYEAFAGFTDWGAPRHFLDVGVGGTYMAIGYDLMYDAFSKDQRAVIEDAFKTFAVDPGWAGMNKPEFWTDSNANWNPICQTGIRLCCYMLYDKDPEYYGQIITTALNRQTHYYRAFEPDGQSAEGIGYFNYGFSFTELGNQADLNVLGTDFGLMDTDGIRNAGWFPYRISGTAAGVSIGDEELHYAPNTSRIWLASRFQDAGLAKLVYSDKIKSGSYEWRDLLFYDPELYQKAMSGTATMPQLDNYVRDIELVSFRNGWGTKDRFISIHAGDNQAPHGHVDAGQVDIQANGICWVMGSLGKEDYQMPGVFDVTRPGYEDPITAPAAPGRYHLYKLRTEGKSAVVINAEGTPDIRPEQDEYGVAKVDKIVSKPQGGYCIVDLYGTYHRDAESYRRGIRFSENRRAFTIQDEIVTKKNTAKVHWSVNTPARINISGDGKTAVLDKDGEKMFAQIKAPANAKFSERAADYLEGEEFPLSRNTPHAASKLAIDLQDVAEVTISVDFIPLDGGIDAPEVTPPAVTPMAEWNIPDGPLIKEEKPALDDIKINGTSLADFQSDFYNYTYMTDLPADSAAMPEIVAVTDLPHEIKLDGNTATIVVSDKNNAAKQAAYVIHVLKQGLPEKASPLEPVSAEASDTPEPQHTAAMTIDGSEEEESRWSAPGDQWIQYDLGTEKTLTNVRLMTYLHEKRGTILDVETSRDGVTWQKVYSGKTEVSAEPWQMVNLTESQGRYLRLCCHGTTDGGSWNSIIETKIYGY